MAVKSSFRGLGAVAQGVALLEEHGMELADWQRSVINDPIQRGVVAAAAKYEIPPNAPIKPQDWADRELAIGQELAKCGLPEFDQALVEKAATMGVGVFSRFVPELGPKAVNRRLLLEVAGKSGIKLNGGSAQAADRDGEQLASKACVFRLDYSDILRPFDPEHRPFILNYDEQWTWATEIGGNGFSTAEKTIYVAVLRPWIELGRLPYMGGAIRCKNPYGSGVSLSVGFDADSGFSVDDWLRSVRCWFLWALPEVSQELGS